MASLQFDIAIIGAGPGGYSAALRAAELGKSVVMVERDETLGGTCLNRGCIPSKALITATRTLDALAHGEAMGIVSKLEEIDFGRLRDYRERTVATLVDGLRALVEYRGITVYHGDASLGADRHVRVVPSPGQDHVHRFAKNGGFDEIDGDLDITADDVVLATGSRPRELPGTTYHGAIVDSTAALSLDTFPHSAVIIGSGAVALEFASIWNSAGSDVTLLIRKDNVLSKSDRRAALALSRELKRRGIHIIRDAHVRGVDTGINLGACVHYTLGDDDEERTICAEIVLGAIGRTPNTDEPWLADSGVALDDAGMVVIDAYGRTNLNHVWALGDITAGHALAHRAFAQGLVVAETIAGLDARPVNEDAIANIVFSSPEFATVGLTLHDAQADARYADVKETVFPVMSNPRMVMSGTGGSFSIVTGRDAERDGDEVVLGVHVVAPDASDMIAEAQQIVANHIPLHEAADAIHPHPTFSEMIGETLLKADGRPLHTR